MPSYRIFRLRARDGRREPGEWLEAAHDDDALRLARELANETKVEVWLQNRLVGIAAGGASLGPQPEAEEIGTLPPCR